jgi:hypothetical protein
MLFVKAHTHMRVYLFICQPKKKIKEFSHVHGEGQDRCLERYVVTTFWGRPRERTLQLFHSWPLEGVSTMPISGFFTTQITGNTPPDAMRYYFPPPQVEHACVCFYHLSAGSERTTVYAAFHTPPTPRHTYTLSF